MARQTGRGHLETLDLVPCHGLCTAKRPEDIFNPKEWHKIFDGESPFYVEHIKAGLEHAARNPLSLLVFSGGQTVDGKHLSEAKGYRNIAQLIGGDAWDNVYGEKRVATENLATDTFQVVDYSIGLFHLITGHLPDLTRVFQWDFKKWRIMEHAEAMGIDPHSVINIGVNNPPGCPNEIEGGVLTPYGMALKGEERTIELFRQFPNGDGGELLEKRKRRNPHNRKPAQYAYTKIS